MPRLPGLLNRYQDPRPLATRSGGLCITCRSQAEALDLLPEVNGGHGLVEALTANGDRSRVHVEGLVPREAAFHQLVDINVGVNGEAEGVTDYAPHLLKGGEAGGLPGQLDNLGQVLGGVDGFHGGLLH
nr:MAG TPA: hypothetical protein [Caudoviricetes sp.]